jgi:hypothetical protein
MTQQNEIIKEIIQKGPNHTWLKMKLSELDAEIANINADRNRLVSALSRARTKINRLRAGLE